MQRWVTPKGISVGESVLSNWCDLWPVCEVQSKPLGGNGGETDVHQFLL